MPDLVVTSADGRTRTVPLNAGRITLGRSDANELSFAQDTGLSRQHLCLEREGGAWFVADLGSKNGTFVNGARIGGRTRLQPGDRIVASGVVAVFDPEHSQADRRVVFEPDTAPADPGMTVSTTLDALLAGRAERIARPAGPRGEWLTPVQALLRAGRELAYRRPLPELMKVILDLAVEAVGATRGVLLTLDRGSLTPQAWRGEGFRISSAVRDRVVNGKTSILVRDTSLDESLRERGSIVTQSVRTLMAAPLQTDDRVIGLLYVDSPHGVREFDNDDLNLLTVMANVAAIRIERERLAEVEQAERLLEAQLEQAAEIQRRFLPECAPQIEGVDLAGYNAACQTVGGDYYDFLPYPDGRVALVIADVAGKGMPAALLMTSLHATVHAVAETHLEPAAVVCSLNRSLIANCPGNKFVTLFYCVLDPRTGEVVYSNAGHNPPWLIDAGGTMQPLAEGGPVLGILSGMQYGEGRATLAPGGALVLYSDGVTEACSPAGEEFERQFAAVLREHRREPAGRIVEAVRAAVQGWLCGQPPADDLTLVAARLAK